MKSWLKIFLSLSLLLGTLLCLLMALHSEAEVRNYLPAQYSLENSPVEQERGLAMQEREQDADVPLAFTLWGQTGETRVDNKELGRTQQVSLVFMAGHSNNVYPGSRLDATDMDGCLIDEGTALSLFESANAVGRQIEVDSRELTVRGLLPAEFGNVAAVQVDKRVLEKKEEDVPSFTVLSFASSPSEKSLAAFRNRQSLAGERMELSYFAAVAKLGSSICFLHLLLGGTALFFRRRRRLKDYPVVYYFSLPGFAVLFVCLWLLLGLSFSPDARFFPQQISDFSFYPNLITEIGDEITLLSSYLSLATLRFLSAAAFRGLGWGMGALACLLVFGKLTRVETSRALFGGAVVSIVLCFAAFLFVRHSAESSGLTLGYWLLFPSYLLLLRVKRDPRR